MTRAKESTPRPYHVGRHGVPHEQAEAPGEQIADAILAISEGMRRLRAGRLNEKAIALLIQHAAPGHVTLENVRNVLDGIDQMDTTYLRKRPHGESGGHGRIGSSK